MNNTTTTPGIDALKKQVAAGARVSIMENDTQRQMSLQSPRDPKKSMDMALAELEAFKELAKTAYYAIPYKDRSGEEEKTTWIEGISIKGAMSLFRYWGNASNGARVTEDLEDRILVEGVYLDYETNTRTLRSVNVSRLWRNKRTQKTEPLRDDRLTIAIQAGMSKAVRNAILAALPEGYKQTYFNKAKELVSGITKEKPLKQVLDEVLAALNAEFEIKKVDAIKILGGKSNLNKDDVFKLQGTLNALRDGQITRVSLLADKKTNQPATSQVSIADIQGAN